MKRKLVGQGVTALTVSLPSEWIKKHNLNKGDEVSVNEKGSSLIINSSGSLSLNRLDLDVSGMDTMVGRLIGAAYKSGYDEIEVKHDNPEELQKIQKVLGTTCMGYEIIQQSKNSAVIKTLTKIDYEEFNTLLRRCFLSLLSIAEETLEAFRSNDTNSMKSLVLRDMSINRYCDFLRRVLVKKGFEDHSKTAPVYYIVEQLERIGDLYRDMNKSMAEKNITPRKELLDLLSRVNSFFRTFYDLYYRFDLKTMDAFGRERKELNKEAKDLEVRSDKDEIVMLFYINSIFENIFDANGALMMKNI